MQGPDIITSKFVVCKIFPYSDGLSAVYRQHRADSHCRYLHGYALQFEIILGCDKLDKNGWVYDFGQFTELKQFLRQTFDHKLLVAQDDPKLHLIQTLASAGLCECIVCENVGTEAFAAMVYKEMVKIISWNADTMGRDITVKSVTCREHGGNAAMYIDAEYDE